MSQKKQVLEYITKHGRITTLDAFRAIGCTRLSGRIYELKADGYDIVKDMVEVKNRHGETCRVAEYRIRRGRKAA